MRKWRGILALLGVVAVIAAFYSEETLAEQSRVNISASEAAFQPGEINITVFIDLRKDTPGVLFDRLCTTIVKPIYYPASLNDTQAFTDTFILSERERLRNQDVELEMEARRLQEDPSYDTDEIYVVILDRPMMPVNTGMCFINATPYQILAQLASLTDHLAVATDTAWYIQPRKNR